MGSRLVPQRRLHRFLTDLEENGRANIRRSPARFDGMVEVSWDDPPQERQLRRAVLKGYRHLMVISFLAALLIAAVITLISF